MISRVAIVIAISVVLGVVVGKLVTSEKMKNLIASKTKGPKSTIISIVVIIITVAAISIATSVFIGGSDFWAVEEESNSSQVIRTLSKEEQVVLVNLGISEIYDTKKTTQIFGKDILGAGKAKYLHAEFDAKLGIDGKNVTIKASGDNEYKISIPEFIFIGHNNEKFEIVVEEKGLLSFLTPDIDETEMINEVLNSDAQKQYISNYQELLEESTKDFYGNIINSVEPEAKLTFVFPKG